MIRRLFWVSVGVGVTVYVLTKANKANSVLSRFTPDGVSESLTNVASSIRQAASDLKEAMAEHEQALTQALTEPPNSTNPARSRSMDPVWDTDFFLDPDNPPEL